MEINKIQEITLNTEETIITATLSAPDEWVILMSSGNVIRHKIDEPTGKHLFSVQTGFSYSDGGFDLKAPSTIYTLDSIVVLVNDYKRHGFIHYPGKYRSLHLWREDYHASISRYPIALYKNELGVPHIIYGVAWNHVQIMNLDTRQVLTAAKSLIEENAEERHIEFYKQHSEGNKLPWPREYDYFYGKLSMSPNQQKFLSAGWVWGSFDLYIIYDLQHFINSNRIAYQTIGGWEHCNRAVCWVNDSTVAITYNPYTEGDENATPDSPSEIHFYHVEGEQSFLEREVEIKEIDLVSATIAFNGSLNAIIAFSEKIGIAVFSLDGQVLYMDKNFRPDAYYPAISSFIKKEDKTVLIYQMNF